MRANTGRVLGAWYGSRAAGKAGGSIWTDGVTIWSYQTALVSPLHPETADLPLVVNVTQYSPTTSGHRNAMLEKLPGNVVKVDGLPMGSGAPELREAARAAGVGS